jgi:MOSC domain-containing protein YiiM
MASGTLVSINLSNGGVPKLPVEECAITTSGLNGDRQRDLRHHGGEQRAVSLFSSELIDALQAEGHPIAHGTIGENLTLSGLDWALVVPGRRLLIGDVELQLTSYASPCRNIASAFIGGDMNRVSQKLHPGCSRLYAKVLREGVVRTGDTAELA